MCCVCVRERERDGEGEGERGREGREGGKEGRVKPSVGAKESQVDLTMQEGSVRL